jgi:hypothetical protein
MTDMPFTNGQFTQKIRDVYGDEIKGSGSGTITLTGDVTATGASPLSTTLATVNSNVGSFTTANITVNAKGLVTAASSGASGITQAQVLKISSLRA